MLRLIRFVTRNPGVSPDQFATFRRDRLGPLVAGLQTALHLTRYVQTHRYGGSTEAELLFLGRRPGASNRFDGIEEYWWAGKEACRAVLGEAEGAFSEIKRLEAPWIDHGRSPAWLAIDFPQVATSVSRIAAPPKSGLLRLVFAICPAAPLDIGTAQRYWQVQHGSLIRSFAAARGILAYNQAHRLPTEAEAVLSRIEPLSPLLYIGHAEAWLSERHPAPGYDGLAAQEAAVADEKHFVDWTRSSVLIGKELVFVDRTWL